MKEYFCKKQTINTFEAAVDYLYDMPRFTSKHTLEDTRKHLARIGSPDKRIRRIIHVAGTNGKGSVCTYMRYILEEAGYSVAVFTSPHLCDIRERIAIGGEYISKDEFLRVFLIVYESLDWCMLERGEGYHPTFFEYIFLMAMLYFAEQNPDYCILETGLGGRLDATNAVSDKILTVITEIGIDHTEYLGSTIPEIAAEKAGIMKKGVPLVYWDNNSESAAVFDECARDLKIRAYPVSKNYYTFRNFENKTIDFSLHTEYYDYIGVTLHTQARYQMDNAALAVRAIEALLKAENDGIASGVITAEHIRAGLEKAYWPGRMEEILPEVFVDGAHNEDGIRAFIDTVREDGCSDRGQKRALLFSAVRDKDYRLMMDMITESRLFDSIYLVHMGTDRAVSGADMKLLADTLFFEDVRSALKYILSERDLSGRCGERIYITGSLYLVGEIKEFLGNDQF